MLADGEAAGDPAHHEGRGADADADEADGLAGRPAAGGRRLGADGDRHQIEVFRGTASFLDAHTLRVDCLDGCEQVLQAPVILIATGSYPNWPEQTPQAPERLYDSDTILQMHRIPRSLAVIVLLLVVLTVSNRLRATPVQRVEEELGLGGGIEAEAAEQVVEG